MRTGPPGATEEGYERKKMFHVERCFGNTSGRALTVSRETLRCEDGRSKGEMFHVEQ